MTIEIKVPVLPESVTDATIVKWHQKEGAFVKADQPLVDFETDKVVLEVVAPVDGILEKILCPEGEKVLAKQVVAQLKEQENVAIQISASITPQVGSTESVVQLEVPSTSSPKIDAVTMSQVKASPSARKMMHEHDIHPEQLVHDRKNITVQDIEKQIQNKNSAQDALTSGREEQRVPMTRLRQRIAQRLIEAQQQAAILTTFNEVDLSEIMKIRQKHKDAFEKTHGVKLGFMSFFTHAVVLALQKYPIINSSIDGNDIVYHSYCDIGVAVSSPRGLIVPILRDVQHDSLASIERKISELAQKAREGTISLEELTGGTFTITNGGVFGSMLSTPILNPPQSAILGMHRIQDRAVVVDGQIVIRPMMYLALSYDHRLIDGSDAVSFLVEVRNLLQEPDKFLLAL